MSALCKRGEVAGVPIGQLDAGRDLDEFDILITAPELSEQLAKRTSKAKILAIPFVYFDRFHPDITYVKSNSKTVLGPCDAYHSLIVFAGFMAGLSISETASLFCEEIFERLGYLSGWGSKEAEFLAGFKSCDLNIDDTYRKWLRAGSFMHTVNHPHVEVLFDISRVALKKAGVETNALQECVVSDNLKQASIWPIYPEIGARISLHGSYMFKKHAEYRVLGLDEFITASYAVYQNLDKLTLRPEDAMRPVFNKLMEVVS